LRPDVGPCPAVLDGRSGSVLLSALLFFARQRLGRASWPLIASRLLRTEHIIGPLKEELCLAWPLQTGNEDRRQGNLLGINWPTDWHLRTPRLETVQASMPSPPRGSNRG